MAAAGVHTQDQCPQVRLQGFELICVILQLLLCDPPWVVVRVVLRTLLITFLSQTR